MDLSIVAPVYNEEDNVSPLYEELKGIMSDLDVEYEIIFVDDGSSDSSYEKMRYIASKDRGFKAIKLRRNFGQSSALQAGFDRSQGDVVVSIDADLQNNPADIPILISKLKEGYDCVSGWRKERKDPMPKKFCSYISYIFRRLFFGTELHDYGCTLKAFTREAIDDIRISGEMHRYIPPLLRWRGFKVTEVPVDHRERESGRTSYGTARLFKGFMDMINVWFWQKFHDRPLYLFGGLGLASGFTGFIAALVAVYWKIFHGVTFTSTPLPLFFVFLVLTGILLFVSGLMADVMLKNYYSVQGRRVYSVEETLN